MQTEVPSTTRKRRRLIFGALASIALALALWAFWLEPASLRTREHDLSLPGWPQACGGLRVAVLADLHVGSPWHGLPQLRRIVQAVNAAKPDLVLLAGDYVVQGVGDFWEAKHDWRQALAAVPEEAPLLLFTHNPDVFAELPPRVALGIAGHTHGGQVRIPGIGRPIVPSRHGERYAAGHVVENGRHFFVSTGLGTSILPVRFLVPPEITILNLGAYAAKPAHGP